MSGFFGERTFNTTDENIQARIRCVYLMATSNEYGYVVLNTGNKSETATGYSTLYGDTIGGYAPISDLYKTDCYKLAAFINTQKGYAHIPTEILEKAPSAELAPGQTDQDSLPPYEVLDGILECILEQNLSVPEIVEQGYPEEAVKKTAQLLRINEYKRLQEPMGPRLSKSSFVHDLKLPVTNGFKE
jgi:NAD+ synthase (glutamine-hydrolysing)